MFKKNGLTGEIEKNNNNNKKKEKNWSKLNKSMVLLLMLLLFFFKYIYITYFISLYVFVVTVIHF